MEGYIIHASTHPYSTSAAAHSSHNNRVAFKLPTHFANLHIPDQVPTLKTNLPKQTALPFFLRFSPVHPLTAQHMIAGRGKRSKKPEKNRSHDSNARKQRSSPKGPTGPEQAEG